MEVTANVYKERFKKIIDFLEELDNEKFNYGIVADSVIEGQCGSMGCVLGWFPNIFPDEFTLGGHVGYPVNMDIPEMEVEEYLGIDDETHEMLFEPGSLNDFIENHEIFNEYAEFRYLDRNSSVKAVAGLFKEYYKNEF